MPLTPPSDDHAMMEAVGEAADNTLLDWNRHLGERLRAWLPSQRWFAGKATPITGVELVEGADLGEGRVWLLAEVQTEATAPATYQIFVRRQPGRGTELNTLEEEPARAWWLKRIAGGRDVAAQQGMLQFESFATGLGEGESSRLGSAEQSNTSVIYRDRTGSPRWVLKFFRHLLPGENPEFELPRALAAEAGFSHVPAPAGRVVYQRGESLYTLATLQPFIANRGDGWEYVLGELRSREPRPHLLAEIGLLGRRTAELHLALASIPGPAFAPEPISAGDLDHWRSRALAGAGAPILKVHADLLADWRRRLAEGGAGTRLSGCFGYSKIRLHGDFHLGQVLKTAEDFYLFDFEGEPVRPLEERRRKGCVLQDVAGMLRSFGYAAHTAGRPEWEAAARQAFLQTYRATLEASAGRSTVHLVPRSHEQFMAVVRFFEYEKAVYELAYELAHRPDWVPVPLDALRRMNATAAEP